MITAETRVCNGFPVTVQGEVLPPDPSVGAFEHDAEIYAIGFYSRRGRWRSLPFLERKMTEADYEACRQALIERY